MHPDSQPVGPLEIGQPQSEPENTEGIQCRLEECARRMPSLRQRVAEAQRRIGAVEGGHAQIQESQKESGPAPVMRSIESIEQNLHGLESEIEELLTAL